MLYHLSGPLHSLLSEVPTGDFRALLNCHPPSPPAGPLSKDSTRFFPLFILLSPLFLCEWVMCLVPWYHPTILVMSTCPAVSSGKIPVPESPWTMGVKKTLWYVNLWILIPGTWHLFKTVSFVLSNYFEMISYHWLMGLWVILFPLYLTAIYIFCNYKCYTMLKCFSIV